MNNYYYLNNVIIIKDKGVMIMGIKKITGIVVGRELGYIKIKIAGRSNNNYDLLECKNSAKGLNVGDRFCLYATPHASKRIMGKKTYTFTDPTEKPEKDENYMLKCKRSELEIIKNILSEVYDDLEYEKKFNKLLMGRQKEVYMAAGEILKRISRIMK